MCYFGDIFAAIMDKATIQPILLRLSKCIHVMFHQKMAVRKKYLRKVHDRMTVQLARSAMCCFFIIKKVMAVKCL